METWQNIEGLAGFSGFLLQLAERAKTVDAREGRADPETGAQPPQLPQSPRTISDYFWAWNRVLGDGLYRGAPLPLDAGDAPGWRGLAFQAQAALTVSPSFNCVLADSELAWREVSEPQHLRQFLGMLATSVARDRREMQERARQGLWAGDGGEWAHHDLPAFLDAWGRWLHDKYLRAHTWPKRQIEPVTWQSIAIQLSAARIYE